LNPAFLVLAGGGIREFWAFKKFTKPPLVFLAFETFVRLLFAFDVLIKLDSLT